MLGVLMLVSSCGSYTATGAYVGAQFGHVIGSAVGGIAGGWRGHDVGSLIGTLGGAAAGAAIGAVAEEASTRRVERRIEQRRQAECQQTDDESGFDPTGSGDDRIEFDEGTPESSERSYTVDELSRKFPIEIRNAQVLDKSGDGVLMRGEECTVRFEIMNNTNETVYDLCPLVEDATGNKHVAISPNLRIESIAPHRGVRYTATILADRHLKDGQIVVRVGVARGQEKVTSQTRQFTIPTKKK